MTFESAVAAVEGALADESAAEASEPSLFRQPEAPVDQAAEPSAPQGESEPSSAAPQSPEAPETPAAPVAPVDTFDNGLFNPDTLPAELKPAWAQLQAAFTRKTQEVAEQRRALEGLGDVNDITQAVQLYQQLQDPNNWPQLQRELGQLMEQRGITAPPAAPATPSMPGVDPTVLNELSEYPELAPVVSTMQAMQARMDEMSRTFEARVEAFQREQAEAAVAGEFARQEAVLLAQGRSESDMDRIQKLAVAHQGNLLAAANEFDAWKSQVLSEYVASKQEAERSPLAPVAGAAASSTVPKKPETLEQATDIALETLKAAGLDTIDW